MRFLLAAIFVGVTACSSETTEEPVDEGCGGRAAFANPGPFAAGVLSTTIGDTRVEVWYPAAPTTGSRDTYDLRDWFGPEVAAAVPDEEAPTFRTEAFRDVPVASGGPFPLVLFSHGLGSYRAQSTFLTSHLASWGYVVAAPDHPERGVALLVTTESPRFDLAAGTLLETIDAVAAVASLEGRVDFGRIAATGHSAGGSTASAVAGDARISSWISLASGGDGSLPDKPALIMAGARDAVVRAVDVRRGYDALIEARPRRYVSLFGAGHQVFTDICLIAQEQGGLVALARRHGVEVSIFADALAEDGCRPGDLKPDRGWPVIRHYVTAHLEETLRSRTTDGFGEDAAMCFGGRIAERDRVD